MTAFSMDDLKELIQIENGCCISMYIPAEPPSTTGEAQRIRFKNQLRSAEKAIDEQSPACKKAMEKPLQDAQRLLEDEAFWRTWGDSLAVFMAPEIFRYFRVPMTFDELHVVAGRFHIKPLVPLLSAEKRFYVLALSQNRVRLVGCTRHRAEEVEVEGLQSMEKMLGYDKQTQLQYHSGAAGVSGGRPAVYHGQGVGIDDTKDEILRYFQEVDRVLQPVFLNNDAHPLVLAGVDYLLPIFRKATSYRQVMEPGIEGNPEHLRAEELRDKAWEIVRPEFEKGRIEAARRYRELAGTGYTASDVPSIVPAAAFSRVDVLFLTHGKACWGRFDRQSSEVTVQEEGGQPGSEDLLDLAAAETFRNGGTVYLVEADEMPEANGQAAAILRY
ncbi:MAG: hypothetical protein ACOWWM_13610 [Desulfobacterales bacterium]